MAKDSLYFSHDFNARNDRKISALVMDYKSAGYGIFWAACEMMHEEGGELELDDLTYSAISKDLNEDFELVKTVIEGCISKYKLFIINEEKLNSKRVSKNLNKKQDISEKRRQAAFAKHLHTNGEQNHANGMQNGAKKERNKVKKENRGVKFSADGLLVYFEDDTSQELGPEQRRSFKEGGYDPAYITKGKIR